MITRRSLLKLSAALGSYFGAFGSTAVATPIEITPSTDDLAAKLVGVLRQPQSAAELGRAAQRCKLCGSGSDALESTVDSVLQSLRRDRRSAMNASEQDLRSGLQTACREDFANARTANLEGWLLSQTEIRIASIAHAQLSGPC